ncbi:uncharacterized protein LOC112055624 isoform X2 [Bicyclus anynana]|uniref:Uncharacterized protein LOC112055624 isoform X2 n=1 Tax=Bicyclus anynana TaxID=110368 RepID=A0A6J1P176_BICAN|nr:uncharacterized protein LOC112055624 isoform X2 [Bicyclus anynana]
MDIQSWWEVPSIAYFCSLFRTAFNLLDFDIEELEEALLTDGTEESASSLLTELIVRLLNGCLGNNDISAFNYQMYLRRLFRQKCQDSGRFNPFNTDIDFQFLPLRTKVEILYALCDFRLDAEDVFDLFKNLEAESLRVEPLGWDDNASAYWYFYGTRLYREDIIKKKGKSRKKKRESRKRGWFYGDDWLDDEEPERVWQVVCFTEDDWNHLTEKFSKASSKVEKELHRSLSQNFLPEIPRLFQEKERLQRKRLLELAPRRTSSRVLQKIKQKEEESKQSSYDSKDEDSKESPNMARENRARRRNQIRSKSSSSDSSDSSETRQEVPQKIKRTKAKARRLRNSSSSHKNEPPPEPIVKSGRKTNNSLSAATGQIVIPDNDEPVNSTRKKLKTSQIFSQTEEDVQTDMYKVLEQLIAHEDAWPFVDPVEEEYAPNYYAVIRRPMDLRKMEQRLDNRYYTDFSMFKDDFKLIVNNCRLYNGQDNEYTTMVDNLQAAFDRLTEKYIDRLSSSDEEIAVEYQLPTPSRKHKLKSSESPERHKPKKRKSNSDAGDMKSSSSEKKEEDAEEIKEKHNRDENSTKKSKESHKSRHDKSKKKRKGHKRHGKHSKNHKKNSHKSHHESKRRSRKHGKNKDKEGKKSKQKKKKNKHHNIEPVEILKRSESQESLESSNRSRSASPLPSIHTLSPTPSPTELDKPKEDQPTNIDFFKDKFDNIKERRRHAGRTAWESLFDFKQKADEQKHNIGVPEKEKNQKLRETIEKLKAKNEKYKGTSLFNTLFTPGGSENGSRSKDFKGSSKDEETEFSEDNTNDSLKEKPVVKKGKKSSAKNASASEALEQAVKDISKWLDDAPKTSVINSPCDSPAQTISTEDHDNSRLDDESSLGEKPTNSRKEICRKRPSSREPKIVKRREIQRTIERLQPGKSKGNLLTNKNIEKAEEVACGGDNISDSKKEGSSPKLSLGSVLATVEFTLGNDHTFNDEPAKIELPKQTSLTVKLIEVKSTETQVENKPEEAIAVPTKKDAEVETDPSITIEPSQEKATPNLSAWFKAFGAPKPTSTLTNVKKKVEGTQTEEKVPDKAKPDSEPKPMVTKNTTAKVDSPNDLNSPIPDGGDSPIPSVTATSRQRRTSTGSSISERSSFSQDLDSPRHQMSHTSPLLRSPASPRTDDFQKITYPIINGTVRAGFYHDTTSVRSSPEKSCSPRDAPQSPYSPYSPHVYATNNAGSATPIYFVDHNKSPLPTYGQNAPPYYDTSKAPLVSKPPKVHEDYTSLSPDSFQQNHFNGPFSPSPSPYPPVQTNYSQPQISPQPSMSTSEPVNSVQVLSDLKTSVFPVKKRTYNEPENPTPPKALPEKETIRSSPAKNDYPKSSSLHPHQSMTSTSVDDIALALSEKSEALKLNTFREKPNAHDYNERHTSEHRDNVSYDNNAHSDKKEIHHIDLTKSSSTTKKDNIDMVNMGYMNVEDRRNNIESTEVEFVSRELKSNMAPQHKGFDIEAIAINLGISNQQLPKLLNKSLPGPNMTPAHTHERPHNEVTTNQNIPHAHHNQYDSLPPAGQPMNTFSLNDIEMANKKLYAANSNNSSSSALDYGNWKMNQMRKPELPSDYSANSYATNNDDKLKTPDSLPSNPINYNKNVQQFSNYNYVPRSSTQRTQEAQQNLPAKLRIPNPRGHLKADAMNPTTSVGDSDTYSKSMDAYAKSQKSEKLAQNHTIGSAIPYKTPYTTHSSLPIETLRNLSNIPQMLEQYSNDERYLSNFASNSTSLYYDKPFMYNKNKANEAYYPGNSIYSQATISNLSIDNNRLKSTAQLIAEQMDIDARKFRESTSQIMAANYVVAAVARQHRNNEAAEKMAKTHQNPASHQSTSSFPFIGHSQVRASYPFVGVEPSSPLYQQYLQRYQEELQRQTGAQIMGLYPSAYSSPLGVRQPYDSINRPSWL